MIPIGMIQAITNRQIGLKYVLLPLVFGSRMTLLTGAGTSSVITELIVGFMLPGKPNAMMMCVSNLAAGNGSSH
jgi:hypothetical protein